MSSRNHFLPEDIYHYLLSVSLREPQLFIKLREETAKLKGANMQIAPEEAQFIMWLIEITKPKKVLEIGVFTGYSSLAIACAMPEDGRLVACDIDDRATKMAKCFWEKGNVAHKVCLRIAPALQTLDELIQSNETGTFDFAFIDADKKNYINYYEKTLILLRSGGIMLIDNTLWDGKVTHVNPRDEQTLTIQALNKKLLTDQRVTISMLPIADGLTLLRKR